VPQAGQVALRMGISAPQFGHRMVGILWDVKETGEQERISMLGSLHLYIHGKKPGNPSQANACLQEIEPKDSISPKRPKGVTGF
jgi:hypothetical protein